MTIPARPADGSAPPPDPSPQAAAAPTDARETRDRASRLARLDAHIADAERRVTRQVLRHEAMASNGQDIREAGRLLRTFEAIYVELVTFRQTLLGMPPETAFSDRSAPRDGP